MNNLEEIEGIGEKAIELFNILDIKGLDDLARQKTGDLYRRLFETNREKSIVAHLPPISTVEEWVAAARILRGVKGSGKSASGRGGANGDGDRAAQPADEIVAVEPAEWMRLYSDAREARVLVKPAPEGAARARQGDASEKDSVQSNHAKLAKHGEIHPNEGLRPSAGTNQPVARLPRKEIALAPAPEKTAADANARADSEEGERRAEELPPRARRGLLHLAPKTVYAGAVVAVVTRLLFFALILGGITVPFFFPEYLLAFAIIPALLLVFAILYALIAPRVRCRVCGAAVLVSRQCHKHENSHRVPGFGYVGSLSLHALLFSWFRCQYCGTPMKLKE